MNRTPAILTIDTREQRPYRFDGCTSKFVYFDVQRQALPAGDYAASLLFDYAPAAMAVVERKSMPYLLGTLTHGRDRFERELEKLRCYGFAALVIEGDLQAIDTCWQKFGSKAHPAAIVASLIAFSQRFGVHVVFASTRQRAEAYVWRLLERWCRDRAEEGQPSVCLADGSRFGRHAQELTRS